MSIYCLYMEGGFFEWDDDKAERNARKHGVTFFEATDVFYDPARIEFYDEEHSEEEGRFIAIGFSRKGRLLFVVFTPRGQRARLISARIAERDEQTIYEQNN